MRRGPRVVSEFLAMGGYAAYVWSTFGLTAIVLVINVVTARRRLRDAREDVRVERIRRAKRARA